MELLQHWNTWDKYSISILFLRHIGYLFDNGFTQHKTFPCFSQICLDNCHFNPEKRPSIQDNIDNLSNVFTQEDNFKGYISLLESIKIDDKSIKQKIKRDSMKTISVS
jgi:hypothetical protein